MKHYKGFTLIEILIVIAIVAILATVALPAYNGYIDRSRIKAAQADLNALSLSHEQFYQKRLSYPVGTSDQAALQTAFNSWSPASDFFTYSRSAGTVATYTLQAVGSGGTAGCVLTITQDGMKKLDNVTGSSCTYKKASGGWL